MLSMVPTGTVATPGTFVGTQTGRTFDLSAVHVVFISVSGLTGGTITIQYSPDASGLWYTLDATNLVFTADGAKYAVVGGCKIRAISVAATTGTTLFVGISGSHVHDKIGPVA